MSIKATGQITLVDLTDGQLSVYLSSNLPKTQIYNKKENSFSPDWRETNLQIVPNVSLNQNSISLDKVTVNYKKLITQEEVDLDGVNEKVENGILTINANLLNDLENKTITYIAYLTYENFSARADLTFTLLNEGVDGEDGTSGESGYTFILTNESYIFKGDNNSALNDYVNTTLSAYQGATEQKVKIVSVNGKTASIESTPTGIAGLKFEVSTISETNSPTITFTSTSELTQKNGTIPITFQMKGQTWTKFFSYGIALQGEDAITYWMINNASAIKKNEENDFNPSQIILEAKNNTGVQGVSDYYARFLIEGTIDNKEWKTVYSSSRNEITATYNISNIDYISYRCSMFLADNTDVLLDRQIVPVVSDGKTGIDGLPGKDGISTYFYVKYSANEDGSGMTDTPQNNTKFLGVCSTTAQTAPTSPNAYTWSEIKGKDGENGTPGQAGQDGQSSYLHIKYSNDGISFTGNNGEDLGLYIGTLVDFNEQDSMTFSDYTWKKFVGSDAKSLTLYSSTYVVSYDSYGKLKDEDLITLTAIQQNFEDEVVWTTNPKVTLGSTGLTRTLNPSVFDNIDKVTVTITSSTFTDTITINKIADGNNSNSVGARSSNYNAIDKESAVFINGQKVASLITSEENRGHTLYVIDKDSLLLKSSKTYDTYGTPSLATTLANDILAITDDIIVIITCDASSVNEDLRNAFKSIGGLEKGTWNQQRVSQYIIGMPGIGPNKGYEQYSTDTDNTLITAVPVIVGTGIVLNGTNAYTHIKYSNDGGKTFTYPDSIVSRDINDWVSGGYDANTGIYEENPNRICIPNLIKVEKNLDYYFNTYSDDYQLVLRLYNNKKEFVGSRGAIKNGSFALITYDGYFSIGLFSPTKTVLFEDYVKDFEEGNVIPTVCLETKSGMGDSKGKYFGVYYDNNSEDSTNPASYVWNQITSDEVEVPEITPAQNNYSVILTNESQTIYADNDGNVSSEEIAKIQSEVKVFNGSEECLTGDSGKNKWEKIIWDNLKIESNDSIPSVKRCIIPLTTIFTSDKIQLLSALTQISNSTINDYTVSRWEDLYIEGSREFYIGKITTYIYCNRDYNVNHKILHDDALTIKVNDKIIFSRSYYLKEDYALLSFQKGYNKVEIYWTQSVNQNGYALCDYKLSEMDFVDKMDCYGYKHYDLSIKSQTPNIGAKINSTKTGFIATSIPKNVNSGNVILTITMFDGTTIDKEFNWTKSKKGDTGESGADGLTVVLTNENHSFPATTNAATASSTSTKILAFKGSTETPIKIKTVNGKTVSTTSIATGITGLNFKVSSINSVVEPTITFTASTSLTTTNGSLPIVMEIDGQTITKNFSFSLALKGASGANGTSITINSTSITYQVSTSGTVKPTGTWKPTIPSVPNGQYLWTKTTVKYSDGTTTDSYSVAYKGTNGVDGTDGKNGISTYTYIKYASNSNGSDMSDNPTNKTYIGVYTGTSATAPTSANSYTWSKFKGDTGATGAAGADGKDGNGIKTISYYYKVTTTQTPPEASTITSTTIPSLSPTNKYLWQKEIIDFSDSAIADKITVSLLAVYGNTGATGANGQNGEDAYLVDINPSSQIFKSTDGGSTFSPNTITLTPRFQNVSFGSWQYSINGGTTWTTITNTTSSTTNCYYSASTKVLTIPKNFSAYTETVTSIVFKCIGSISTVYDTVTVAKLYDVTDLEVGGKNLLMYTTYKNLKGVSVRGNYGTVSIDTTNKYNNNNSLKIVTTAPATSGSKDIWQKCWNNNIIGLPIRLSLYIKGSVNANAFFRLAGATASNGSSASFKHSVTTSWTKISIDLGKITASGTKGATEIIYGFDRAGTFYINSMMLEYSTVYSDWSPAPEDTQAELDEKVERTSIKAAINASDETVKIEATNIDLEGYATFTSLAGNSTSVINGSNITTGTIKSKNYAQNVISSSRLIALNDDLTDAKLNMNFVQDTNSVFLDNSIATGTTVLLLKTSNYYITYYKYLKGTNLYSCDEVNLYQNDGTLLEQLYWFDGQYGKLTNLTTYNMPSDADRVIFAKSSNRVYQMIKAKMTKQVATAGMKISLEDGVIDSKNFSVSAEGDIYISGKVKSKQDNILLNTDVFDILNDYGDLLMELNSYGMDFYDGSSARRYTGFIGHGIQDMTIYIGDGETTETKLEQCDGLLIAAYPQESTTDIKNYFVGLGLANSDREVVPLVQAYGYPNSDASTEFHYTIDIGKTTFHETSSHCDGLRIKSGEVCSYYLNGGDLSLEEDADLTRWTLTLKSKSLKMGTSSSNIGTYPTILYDNSSGTNGTVNLKETTALFDYIDIIYKTNDNLYGTIRVYNPNGKTVDIFSENTDNNNKWIKSSIKQISGTQIITSRFMENTLTNGSLSLTLSNLIYITKVIGYK